MIYSHEELKKLQATELEVLKEVIRVCEENDITYYGFFGTALGAVRHKGFIPWDDDIDIAMLREDYERFLKIAPSKLSSDYSLQHFTVEHDAPAYFAKVRKNGTRFVESNLRHLKIHHGVFIDIFPLDKVPQEYKLRKRHYLRTQFWLQLYLAKTMRRTAVHIIRNPYKRFCADLCRFCMHFMLAPVKKSFLFEQLEKTKRKYNDTDSKLVSYGDKFMAWDWTKFEPTVKVPFEDTSMSLPANYDEILTIIYSDYMVLPPEEKRVSHMPLELKL